MADQSLPIVIISAHQPVYLPGVILFNKISLSEAIVFIGHVQMEKTSWQTRNRIRDAGKDGEMFLSVPIRKKGRFGQSINETELANELWSKKHLKSIYFTYKNRPFFDVYFERLKDVLEKKWVHLSDLNIALIGEIMKWLNIDCRIIDSRELNYDGSKTELLVSICKDIGAAEYISNPGSVNYVDEALFTEAGIKHHWQKFESPVYDQGQKFVPDLSVIDLLFNAGPEADEIVRSSGATA